MTNIYTTSGEEDSPATIILDSVPVNLAKTSLSSTQQGKTKFYSRIHSSESLQALMNVPSP